MTNDRWGVGVAVGDYDNDGWPDLYVTNLGKNRLYHNNHDGTFTDVAEKAGVALGGWSTGPTLATTTAMGGWICLCPATPTTTSTIRPPSGPTLSSRITASIAAPVYSADRAD